MTGTRAAYKSDMSAKYKLSDIVVETNQHFAIRVEKGFEVYRVGITHATRCAIIGYTGERGLERVRAEIARRENAPAARWQCLTCTREGTGAPPENCPGCTSEHDDNHGPHAKGNR